MSNKKYLEKEDNTKKTKLFNSVINYVKMETSILKYNITQSKIMLLTRKHW